MAIPTLFGSYIDETYERLVQVSGSEFADGLGNPITFGTIDTGSLLQASVFNQFTASYNTGSFTGSLEGTASFASTAISSSYPIAITGSTIYSTGPAAGPGLSNSNSIYFGVNAGSGSLRATGSNFLGMGAGVGAVNASNSNFFGSGSGRLATSASNSNFLGPAAGASATNASNSNFLGISAGRGAHSANNSNFLGNGAGFQANNASNSNFLGPSAGNSAANAINSNFLGPSAGFNATNASNSNFLGNNAGIGANNASNSNFLGAGAGQSATNAVNSNFLGQQAGRDATGGIASNFLGFFAGNGATNADNSNFLGANAGGNASSADNSNFLGASAGFAAAGASKSTLIGYQVGRNFGGGSIGANNIIIGTNITLPVGTANAINIGGVLFGTDTYSDVTSQLDSVANGKIGINVVTPTHNFEVSGTVGFPNLTNVTQDNVVSVDIATGQLYYQATGGSGGGSGSSYNVFTALMSQTGGSNMMDISEVSLTVGVTYRIMEIGGKGDFTNVGAPNNSVGTHFIATGTTPASWGSSILRYDEGAPIIKILQNTIGYLYAEYAGNGEYRIFTHNGVQLFTENKTWITPIYLASNLLYIQYASNVQLNISSNGSDSVIQANTPIEIRVYN